MKLIALIHSSLANFNSDLACTEVQRHGHNTKTCSAPESAPGVDAGDEIVFFHGSVLYVLGRGVRCAVMVHNASACLMCCACALEQCICVDYHTSTQGCFVPARMSYKKNTWTVDTLALFHIHSNQLTQAPPSTQSLTSSLTHSVSHSLTHSLATTAHSRC